MAQTIKLKQLAEEFAEKYVAEKNLSYDIEDEVLDIIKDSYIAGYNTGANEESVVRINIAAIPIGWTIAQLCEVLSPHKVLVVNEPSPWIAMSEEEPPEPTDWDIKGIVGIRESFGFLDMWLFGYVYPDGWAEINTLGSPKDYGIQYWMKIPQLPKAVTEELLKIGGAK